ncbi:flagellar hook-basal body protein [Horticoccus sp. 23ND18S-11]|uniref:flagellar hook-basal body protein n=1 Tax=Horticoccus sp. 23ND18S-11 TaxID=3391832 RepID=UPI0039C9763B
MSLIGTLGSGVSALRTFMKGLEVIGANIANVNTTGYKSSEAKYADSFSNILQRSSPSTATTSNSPSTGIGTGVVLAGVSTNFSQGSLGSTGKETDLGISGNGFFHVKNVVDSTEYATRSGDFRWDDQGYLVSPQGFRVQGATGAGLTTLGDVKLGTPPVGSQRQAVTIDKAGNVVEFYSDGSSATTNQVLIQTFNDPSALVKEGNNLYSGLLAAGAVGAAAGSTALQVAVNKPGTNGLGLIQSGTLELSNVDLTDQFANLITTQRSFQAASRLITVSDSVLEDIVNLKR